MISLHNTLLHYYGNTPSNIVPGRKIRFASSEKKRSKSCWVWMVGDDLAFHGDWRTGEKAKCWTSEKHSRQINSMSDFERKRYYENLETKAKEIEYKEKQEKIAYIQEDWATYITSAVKNEYFIRKQIEVMPDMKMDETSVLIPMYSSLFNKTLTAYEKILNEPDKDGKTKRFAYNSYPSESFYPITNGIKLIECDTILLGEGYATCWSANALMNLYSDSSTFATITCFSGHNIAKVTTNFRKIFPEKRLLIIQDNDRAGLFNATKAIQSGANGKLILGLEDGQDANDDWCRNKEAALKRFEHAMWLLD